MHLNDMARKIRTIGDEARLKILCVIMNEGKICVSEIAKKLDLSIAIVSHHLQALKEENILTSERDGKNICYRLSNDNFTRDFKELICKYK